MLPGTTLLYSDADLRLERLDDANILCATLLDTTLFSELNLKDSFFKTMEAIERYAVKKIIFQSSQALLNLPPGQYALITEVLLSGLAGTDVEKAAYVYLEGSEREKARIAGVAALLQEMGLPLAFRQFTDRQSAVDWLETA